MFIIQLEVPYISIVFGQFWKSDILFFNFVQLS